MTPNRERLMVGLFVVIAAAVLSVTAVAVWGGMGRSGIPHRLYLKFSGGIQPGTPVRYGGLRVGTVQSVRIDPGDSTRIQVDVIVGKDTPIKTNSVARLSTLGFLSEYYIEISMGTPQAPIAESGSVLRSEETTGLMNIGTTIDNMVPQINGVLNKLTLDLDSLQTVISDVNDLLNDRNRSNIGQVLARADDLLNDRNRSNVADSLSNFNQLLAETRPKISAGLDNFNNAAEHLTPLLEDVRKTAARMDETLANVNAMLTEDRPDLKASISDLRDLLETSKATVDQLQSVLNQNTGNIYDILDNIRASSANIRSMTEMIKSSPASLLRGVKVENRRPGGALK